MCVVIVYSPICDAIKLETNLRILIKPFFCITKKSGQKYKYLNNERALRMKQKVLFNIFKTLALRQIKTTWKVRV